MINPALLGRRFLLASSWCVFAAAVAARAALPEIVVTNALGLEPGAQLPARLVVRAKSSNAVLAGTSPVLPRATSPAAVCFCSPSAMAASRRCKPAKAMFMLEKA